MVSRPALVGRERERRALIETFRGSSPVVVLVEGAAGSGKSRLIQEVLASPAARKQRSLTAVCPPLVEPFTLGPLVGAVRQACDRVTGLPLTELAGALRPLLPEWAADLPPALDPPDDGNAARHRLFWAMAELITCLDVSILVVEDLHWADEATLDFLLFLCAGQHHTGLNLMATYRREDLPPASPLLRLSSRVPAGTRQLRLTLRPLDETGTAEVASSMLGGDPVAGQFAEFLHRYTGGLPLAIEESVRLLHDRSGLIRRGKEWSCRTFDDVPVPSTIRDSVLERVQRLSPAAQTLLDAAAVLNEPAEVAVLAAICRLDAGDISSGVAEAIDSGLLGEDVTGRLRVRHMLTASAIYEVIPTSARRQMHQHAGQVLEGVDPQPVPQLARHYRHGNDIRKWSHYAELAADLAVSAGDNAVAITLLIDLVPRADLATSERARLACKLGFVALSRRAVAVDLVRRVVSTLRSVLDTPGITAAQAGEVRNPLGRLLMQMGDYDAGYAELQAAIPHLRHSAYEAARAMIYLGWPRATCWPVSTHVRWLRRAARITPDSISPIDRMNLTVNRATALLLLGQEAGWTVAAELPTGTGAPAERRPLASGHLNAGYAAMLWGRYAEAEVRLATAARLSQDVGHERLSEDIAVTHAHLDWLTGAWDGLADRVRTRIGSEDAEPPNQLEIAILLGLLASATGDPVAAEDQPRSAIDDVRRLGVLDRLMEPTAALARLQLDQGAADLAREMTANPVRTITEKEIWIWGTDVVPIRIQALLATYAHEQAVALTESFRRGIRGRTAPGPKAALTLCRAMLAEANGDHALAANLFGRSAAAWQKLPRPYETLLARERQGRSLLAAGKADTGLAVLLDARQRMADLGAHPHVERVGRTLRAHGIKDLPRPGRKHRGRRGYGDQLSPREIESFGS